MVWHVRGQFGKVASCFQMVTEFERLHQKKYKFVSFVRPDLYFASPVGMLDTLHDDAVTLGKCDLFDHKLTNESSKPDPHSWSASTCPVPSHQDASALALGV